MGKLLISVVVLVGCCGCSGFFSKGRDYSDRTPQETVEEQKLLDAWQQEAIKYAVDMDDEKTSLVEIADAAVGLSEGKKREYADFISRYFSTWRGLQYVVDHRESQLRDQIVYTLGNVRRSRQANREAQKRRKYENKPEREKIQ